MLNDPYCPYHVVKAMINVQMDIYAIMINVSKSHHRLQQRSQPRLNQANPIFEYLNNSHFQHNVVGLVIALHTVTGVFIRQYVTRVNIAVSLQHHRQQQHPNHHLVRKIMIVQLVISAKMMFVFLFLLVLIRQLLPHQYNVVFLEIAIRTVTGVDQYLRVSMVHIVNMCLQQIPHKHPNHLPVFCITTVKLDMSANMMFVFLFLLLQQ
ncbi:unnamed protein product [Meloidogyne enterolobii]|uniref:Uncharacterized protein n=1 Tax=Meloidogyne enterolobii TaxID=390850 RepID=A0ACB0ZFN7_MELEN